MELTDEHLDLLRIVKELETPGTAPSSREVGPRLLELRKKRGGAYAWFSSVPWHGTNPHADELRAEGLLQVDVGMAQFRRWDQSAATADQYWFRLTEAGRAALVKMTPKQK